MYEFLVTYRTGDTLRSRVVWANSPAQAFARVQMDVADASQAFIHVETVKNITGQSISEITAL